MPRGPNRRRVAAADEHQFRGVPRHSRALEVGQGLRISREMPPIISSTIDRLLPSAPLHHVARVHVKNRRVHHLHMRGRICQEAFHRLQKRDALQTSISCPYLWFHVLKVLVIIVEEELDCWPYRPPAGD